MSMINYLREPLHLPSESQLVVIADLPEKYAQQLEAESGDYLLSKHHGRVTSKILNAELADILGYFREQKTLVEAIVDYHHTHQENKVESEQLLESLFPTIIELVQDGFLIPEQLQAEQNNDPVYSFDTLFDDQAHDKRIIRCIQQTDDSRLYQARQAKKIIAIKTATQQSANAIRGMLQQEAHILQQLPTGLAPCLLNDDSAEDIPYLVLEWISARPVNHYTAQLRETQDNSALIHLLQAITAAYTRLHQAGWVHRDVHPGNILCDANGKVTLIDFGLAHTADSQRALSAGVSFYLSPETLVPHKQQKDVANSALLSEQYSLAAVLYQLFTGQHYCDFSLRMETLQEQVKNSQPLRFEQIGLSAYPELEKVLNKALAKNPQHRFSSLEKFADALQSVCDADAIASKNKSNANSLQRYKPQAKQQQKFIKQLLKKLDYQQHLYLNDLPHGPLASVNYGASGIAYALYRLSVVQQKTALFSLAEKWQQKAWRYVQQEDAFKHPDIAAENDPVTEHSIFNQMAGVYGVQAILSHAKGDSNQLNHMIDSLLAMSKTQHKPHDLALGSAGLALLLMNLAETTQTLLSTEYQQRMEQAIEVLVQPLLAYIQQQTKATLQTHNLGMAHGISGVLQVLLRWYAYRQQPLEKPIIDQINQLLDHAVPEACGLCIPWQEPENIERNTSHRQYKQHKHKHKHEKTFATMSGWCNGSAGLLMLLDQALPLSKGKQKQYWQQKADAFAQHCWEDSTIIPNLCCGLAGRAYALAQHTHITRQAKWLNYAQQLLDKAITQSMQIDHPEMPAHSLYKGQLGVALAVVEIMEGNSANMPFFMVEL